MPENSTATRDGGSLQPDCWTAPLAEQREMSEVVERRDGYDWRCKYCVETAQECLNGDRGCPYRQPRREQSNAAGEPQPTRDSRKP